MMVAQLFFLTLAFPAIVAVSPPAPPASLAEVAPRTVAAAAPATAMPFSRSYPKSSGFWCSVYAVENVPVANPGVPEFDLCTGRVRKARREFVPVVAYWREHAALAPVFPEAVRGYFISLLVSGRAGDAQHLLALLGGGDLRMSRGDRLFIHGRLDDSLAYFEAREPAASAGASPGPLSVARAAAQRGTGIAEAAAALEQVYGKIDDLGARRRLLALGNMRARLGLWKCAYDEWAAAANWPAGNGGIADVDESALSAMEMMYYYRGHMPAAV